MYISYDKENVLLHIAETEWDCRCRSKGINKQKYWEWLESVTTDGVVDYSGETGYTIVECRDEDIRTRLIQLSDYVYSDIGSGKQITHEIKWQDDIGDAEEIMGIDGKSQDPKVYVQSHLVPDDSARDARKLAQEWVQIRAERDYRIAETDWMMLSDTGTVSTAWKNYRKALREIPQSQDSVKKFKDIDWPDKPSS